MYGFVLATAFLLPPYPPLSLSERERPHVIQLAFPEICCETFKSLKALRDTFFLLSFVSFRGEFFRKPPILGRTEKRLTKHARCTTDFPLSFEWYNEQILPKPEKKNT